MVKIALAERALTGATFAERLSAARPLIIQHGISGLEIDFDGLAARFPDLVYQLHAAGLSASSVHTGGLDGCLSADAATRDHALDQLRVALADAVDLCASGVTFVPIYHSAPPDAATRTREHERMVWLLRTHSDLAYALGSQLFIEPIAPPASYFLNHVGQAIDYRRIIKDHPHVWAAAPFDLMRAADGAPAALDTLRAALPDVGIIYAALADVPVLRAALTGYQGWVVVRGPLNDQAADR